MKHLIYRTVLFSLFTLSITGLTSCSKEFFSDVNTNPNAPDSSKIIPSVLLPTVEGALAYTYGGDLSRFTSILTQQTAGLYRQAAAYDSYTFTTNDFDNVWANLYTSILENNLKLMQLSDKKGYNRYGGISRVLTAFTLQAVVDIWGAIPYSSALKGDGQLKPTFDKDQALYDTVIKLLDVAIVQLNNADPGFAVPGGDDFIYGGDETKWIKFAHAIKARIYIHQSKGNAGMATSALTEIAQSFTSMSDNAIYYFTNIETASGPWYQFNQQRGDIGFVESTLGQNLLSGNDPRYEIYTHPEKDGDGNYTDVNVVGMGDFYGSANAPVPLITFEELYFMRAEATLRATGNIPAAQGFYQQAIDSNLSRLGVSPVDRIAYLATHGVLTPNVTAAIAQVANEEYIALYLSPEAWNLVRRTNSPVIAPTTGGSVPRRLLYPQSEYSNNGANTPVANLLAPKIFWDN